MASARGEDPVGDKEKEAIEVKQEAERQESRALDESAYMSEGETILETILESEEEEEEEEDKENPVVRVGRRFTCEDLRDLEWAVEDDAPSDFKTLWMEYAKEIAALGIHGKVNFAQWTDPIFQAQLACEPADVASAVGVLWNGDEGEWHPDAQLWLTEPRVWKALTPPSSASSNEAQPP